MREAAVTASVLLSKLEAVQSRGPDRWVARCPAHEDGRPSLSILEKGDGRVLLKCFAGCDVGAVLGAVGLWFTDLYPEAPVGYAKPDRRPWRAADLIHLLDRESLIIFLVAADAVAGKTIDEPAMQRLQVARARVHAIAEALC
jgi:hypothetical protein